MPCRIERWACRVRVRRGSASQYRWRQPVGPAAALEPCAPHGLVRRPRSHRARRIPTTIIPNGTIDYECRRSRPIFTAREIGSLSWELSPYLLVAARMPKPPLGIRSSISFVRLASPRCPRETVVPQAPAETSNGAALVERAAHSFAKRRSGTRASEKVIEWSRRAVPSVVTEPRGCVCLRTAEFHAAFVMRLKRISRGTHRL